MAITVLCTSCGCRSSAPDRAAGRRLSCPKCKAPVDVPAPATTTAPTGPGQARPTSSPPPPLWRLIPCGTCGRQIAPTAATCPSCGAPNTWVHPAIGQFEQAVGSFRKTPPFTHTAQGFVLTGTAKVPEQPSFLADIGRPLMVGGMIGLIAAAVLPALPHGLVLLSFAALIAGCVCLGASGRTEIVPTDELKQFRVDFSQSPLAWSSNDDAFWCEVRGFVMQVAALPHGTHP